MLPKIGIFTEMEISKTCNNDRIMIKSGGDAKISVKNNPEEDFFDSINQ